jgi:hypothetical protein
MAVELAGIQLNDNLVLDGLLGNPDTLSSISTTLGGNSVIQIKPSYTSRKLDLVALDSGAKQGWLCHAQIEALKAIANQAQPVALEYNEETYSVLIMNIEVKEWFSWEPINDYKRYSGSVSLQEV